MVGKPFTEEPYGIGVKKDDKAGCDKINEILKAAATDGSYKAAWDKTLGASGKPGADARHEQADQLRLTAAVRGPAAFAPPASDAPVGC